MAADTVNREGDAHLIETKVASEPVFEGKLLQVLRDTVRLPDGGLATREYIVHPGAVLIVPVLPDGRLVIERQFRYPLQQVFVEFPAGKLDPGETALETARRELLEEAGYTATTWTRLGVVHPLLSYSTEAIDMYVAEGLAHVGAQLDDGEFLEIRTIGADEMLAAVDRGEVTDAKTVTALLLYLRWAERQRLVARRVVVRGRVQGVGYRYGMVDAAVACGVTGWVRNRHDGTVEALFEGEADAVARAIAWCRRGPAHAKVTAVEVTEEPASGVESGFIVTPTA